jgi:hypothetical protein
MRPCVGILGVVMATALGCASQFDPRAGVNARAVELGTGSNELLEQLGVPNRVTDRTEDNRTFRTFHYPNGLYCVVDLTTDVVCKVDVGETDGVCYRIH